jgi:hypothetical protein
MPSRSSSQETCRDHAGDPTGGHAPLAGTPYDQLTVVLARHPGRRIARRRGKKRAIVAVGRSILVIIWAPLSDEFIDLGRDYYASRANSERKVHSHVRWTRDTECSPAGGSDTRILLQTHRIVAPELLGSASRWRC